MAKVIEHIFEYLLGVFFLCELYIEFIILFIDLTQQKKQSAEWRNRLQKGENYTEDL